jgi:hypothetical protein
VYYFFLAIVIISYETTATARWALLFIVRAFFNDTITVAVWTGCHVRPNLVDRVNVLDQAQQLAQAARSAHVADQRRGVDQYGARGIIESSLAVTVVEDAQHTRLELSELADNHGDPPRFKARVYAPFAGHWFVKFRQFAEFGSGPKASN